MRILLCIAIGTRLTSAASVASIADWPNATPESQHMLSAKLDALRDLLAAKGTNIFLIVRHDKIVYEWYAPGFGTTKRHGTASLAKALVGATSLQIELKDGRILPDDRVSKFVAQWRNDPKKSEITVRQLATHRSGLEDAESGETPHNKLTGWKGDFWKNLDPPNDPFTISRDLTPVVFSPGKTFPAGSDDGYSNPGFAMLAYTMTAALKASSTPDLRSLLRDRVMRPIGVPDEDWTAGYNKTVQVDGLPLVATWGGGTYTGRATAAVGRLLLHRGDWDGKQILDRTWVMRGTTGDGLGYWAHSLSDKLAPSLPKDAFGGAGAGMELLTVIPSLDLIIVRNGRDLSPNWDDLEKMLYGPLMEALEDRGRDTAPEVDAGLPATAKAGAPVTLEGVVVDGQTPAHALQSRWTKVSGPGKPVFADVTAPATSVTFDAPGEYVLRLTCSDGKLNSSSDVKLHVHPR
jgi:CubicO group peptidase (beta-lactamase class C family)